MLTTSHCVKDDRIFFKESKSLLKAGYEVHLLAFTEEDGFGRDMQGKILNPDGLMEFNLEGIEIHLIKKSNSSISQTLQKVFKAEYQAEFVKKAKKIDADIYHAHEAESLLLAYKVCKNSNNKKLVLDAHESWIDRGKKSAYVLKKIIPKIHYLISANQITRGFLLCQNHLMKTEVIYNSAVFSHSENAAIRSDDFRIIHEGTLKFNRGLKTLLEAILILSRKNLKFEVHFAGYIPEDETKYLNSFIISNALEKHVKILGNIKYEELPEHIKDYNLGLILSTNEVNNYLAGPANKLFNYLAAGIPVLSNDLPDSTSIIKKFDVGKINSISDSKTIADNIEDLILNPDIVKKYSANINRYKSEFLWANDEAKLIQFYSDYLQ